MSTPEADDRREYYRIEDTIALDFRLLSGPEAQPSSVLNDSSPLFNLLSDLHLLDYESQHLLRHISERDRTLASYLKKEEEPGFVRCPDPVMAHFLDGLMIHRRGKDDSRPPQPVRLAGGSAAGRLSLKVVMAGLSHGSDAEALIVHDYTRQAARRRSTDR